MDIPLVSRCLNEFAHNLYRELNGLNKDEAGEQENFFFSPYSVSIALAMTLAGAKDETADHLKWLLASGGFTTAQVLQLNSMYSTSIEFINEGIDVEIKTANCIFCNDSLQLREDFLSTLARTFNGKAEQVDFAQSAAAAKTINTFVAEATNNKIRDLISTAILNASTQFVLVNAVYFKAAWVNKFKKSDTVKENFRLSRGQTVKVDMMKLRQKRFKYLCAPGGLDANALEIPYIGHTVSLTIILPNENASLINIERELTPHILYEIVSSRRGTFNNMDLVNLHLPKFKLEYKAELSEAMKHLGATLPFDQANANFENLANNSAGIHVSKVIHQAVVEVDEEGTEAAAATAVTMVGCSMILKHEDPIEFNCNRPFLFVIHEKVQNNILFYGKLVDPQ